jgi:YegS/Rv2252/BmrU family lipid kinase
MKLHLIVNPKAGSGRAAQRIPQIRRALADHGIQHELSLTEGPRDAARLVRLAADDGAEVIGVVGGDGTLNEVAQNYVDEHGAPRPGPALALIPAGTGGDFRKTFGVEDDVTDAVRRIATATPRAIDLGVVELTGHDGRPEMHAFINIMSFGIGGLTDRLVNESPKWLGGRMSFMLGTLRACMAYRNLPVSVRVDGEVRLETPIVNVAVCNGRYFGGGMMIAPEANPSDGLFDVIALCDLTRAQGIGLALKFYRGSHIGQPGVTVARGSEIEALPLRPKDHVLIDLDGETPGRLPLRARMLRGAVTLLA